MTDSAVKCLPSEAKGILRIKSVLCPIDFSEFSIKAYDYAQSLAAHYRSDLLVLHVMYSHRAFYVDDAYRKILRKLRTDATRKLKRFLKRQTWARVNPQPLVQDGIATDEILSLAETQAVNLIVMGTHGLRGVDRIMVGSVAERVLRKARCPVLVVRKPAHDFVSSGKDTDPVSLKRIVLGMDFSEHAHHSLKYALSFAKGYNAQLTVVHVVEHFGRSSPRASTISKATNQLRESVPPGDSRSLAVKYLARVGKPYQQITELAVESKTDLVILGVRGHGSLNSALFGSTVSRVIQLGPCPVLAVNF
ncbi:MAG: universal stress protein [Acidobacteriota bacterium]